MPLKPMQSISRSPQPQQAPDQVEVTILLWGGQEYTLFIPTHDALLRQLFEVVMDWEGKRVRRLFQIPIRQGQAMLVFPCDRLVGLITNPPLIVQQPLQAAPQPEAAAQDVIVSNAVQLEQFFTAEEHQQLLSYVRHQESAFVSTTTSTGDLSHRQSTVLYSFPEFSQLITRRVEAALPEVIARLGINPFPLGQIESQLTAHNDGHYYKAHNDNGSADTASRELTYVYYFNQEPKQFSGGELRIYDSRIEKNFFVKAESYKTIEPINNSIVFFPSRYIHEVLPIRCPSRQFIDSRFTINGWVRRV